jgi:hypothetical protein
MAERRIPDPVLMAQLQSSERPLVWAAGLVRRWQHQRLDGEWSAHQHVFHLVATELEVYHPRLRLTLAEERPRFTFFDSPGFMTDHYRKEPDIEELAAQFADARAQTVEILRGIGEKDWSRTGTWPDGTEIDLAWFGEKILWHGLDHLATLLDIHGELEPRQGGAGSA